MLKYCIALLGGSNTIYNDLEKNTNHIGSITPKRTSHFRVIAHIWLAFFPESFQMVSKSPSHATCGIVNTNGLDEDNKSLKEGVCNTLIPY